MRRLREAITGVSAAMVSSIQHERSLAPRRGHG
jgi:hypothetical protein